MSTVRIPELTNLEELALADQIAVWESATNKTKKTDLASLRSLILLGESNTYTKIYQGASVVFVVPHDLHMQTVAPFPDLAGRTFKLRREGHPLKYQVYDTQGDPIIPVDEVQYEVLADGGFELLNGEKLLEGETYELDLVDLGNSGNTPVVQPGQPSTTGSLFKGVATVAANFPFDPAEHLWKLLQVRSGGTAVTITLPDISDPLVPANLVVVIETMFGTTAQTTVTGNSGQFIYLNNTNKTSVYMGVGECLWLLRTDDGWVVLNDSFARAYQELGQPRAAFKVGDNEVLLNGQELSRAANPRLWEYAQTLGASLVSDATWLTASAVNGAGATVEKPYRGCFSTGDGSTTFRVPDMMNAFLRGVKTETGSDNERILNKAGGYQQDTVKVAANVKGVKVGSSGTIAQPTDATNATGEEFDLQHVYEISTGTETRGANVGVLWVIKK